MALKDFSKKHLPFRSWAAVSEMIPTCCEVLMPCWCFVEFWKRVKEAFVLLQLLSNAQKLSSSIILVDFTFDWIKCYHVTVQFSLLWIIQRNIVILSYWDIVSLSFCHICHIMHRVILTAVNYPEKQIATDLTCSNLLYCPHLQDNYRDGRITMSWDSDQQTSLLFFCCKTKSCTVFRGAFKSNFWKKIGILSQLRGGVCQSQFFIQFFRTNFTMVNGQKCDETHST